MNIFYINVVYDKFVLLISYWNSTSLIQNYKLENAAN